MGVWIEAIRPKTLGAAIAPVLMGTAIAWSDGLFHGPACLLALICALLIQVGTNFANDYYDWVKGADTPDRLGPTRATSAGLISPNTMRLAFILVFTAAFALGIMLIVRGGWPILLIGICSILFGVLYTGGPYPLGYTGLADIFVLIFFGPVAVAGTYYVQALELSRIAVVAGFAPGLISTALLTINNLRDINTDARAGKRTLVVRFGARFARFEYIASILIACLLPAILVGMTGAHYFSLFTIAAFLLAIPSIRIVLRESGSPVLNSVLANTGRFLLLYSLIFSIGWLL